MTLKQVFLIRVFSLICKINKCIWKRRDISRPDSLENAISDYILYLRASGYAPSTVACYSRDLSILIEHINNMNLNQIEVDMLKAALVNAYYQSGGTSKYSQTTLNRVKSAHRSFFRWAYETGKVKADLSKSLRLGRAESHPTKPFNSKEIRCFFYTIRASKDKASIRDEALFATYAPIRAHEGPKP
jgi:site-specific recombinase XerD